MLIPCLRAALIVLPAYKKIKPPRCYFNFTPNLREPIKYSRVRDINNSTQVATALNEIKYANAFNSVPGVGLATLRSLKKKFGSFEVAWHTHTPELESHVSPRAYQAICWKKPSLHPDREMEKMIKGGIWLITEENEEYPLLLREIPFPPLLLYGKGNLKKLKNEGVAVGVVGTRRPTSYGLEACERITRELAVSGVTIVSGLATGIDARAHETALSERGSTISVIGSGLDDNSFFPAENRGLARRICDSGNVVISEYAPGTPARKEHFPQRNRIISGLSRGILVIEAREKSGALITARFALEQNREVFSVPGSIFSATSKGPHALIQEGAKLVRSAEDILTELGISRESQNRQSPGENLGEDDQRIFALLEEPVSIDMIKEKTGLDTSVIITSLSKLELEGTVANLGQDVYQKII